MRLVDWGRSHTVHAIRRLRLCDLRSHCRSLGIPRRREKESFEEVSMVEKSESDVVM